MALVGDMVVQTANSPGTGAFSLIAPPPGRSTFVSQTGVGQAYYFAADGSSWEKGIGTVASGSPDTLSRDTVLGNSLGTTARINFTGAVTIECNIPAERSLWAGADNSAVLAGNRKLSSVAAGAAPDDAPRLSQVGSVRGQTYAPVGGAIAIPLPALLSGDTFQIIEIDLRALTASADAPYYFRLSSDGGSTYHLGSSDYYWSLNLLINGAISGNGTLSSYAQITGTVTGSFSVQGKIRFDPATAQWATDIEGAYLGNYVRALGSGNSPPSTYPTHMVIGAVNQSITGGLIRVSRVGF